MKKGKIGQLRLFMEGLCQNNPCFFSKIGCLVILCKVKVPSFTSQTKNKFAQLGDIFLLH